MSAFTKLRAEFITNWTTILVGWIGLGVLSPWPDRWKESSPLVSVTDITAYADQQLASSTGDAERNLIVKLLSLDLRTERRETIRDFIQRLSDLDGGDASVELRKWRVVLLEELLDNMPKDALYGLIALTEFWLSFGFPSDNPHEVQGRENALTPAEYYQQENLNRLLGRHRVWIDQERSEIKRHSLPSFP